MSGRACSKRLDGLSSANETRARSGLAWRWQRRVHFQTLDRRETHCKSPQSIRDSDTFAGSYNKTCRTFIHLPLSSCSCRLFEAIITPWYISHVVVSSETASRDKSIAPSSGAGRLVTYQTFNQSVMHASALHYSGTLRLLSHVFVTCLA